MCKIANYSLEPKETERRRRDSVLSVLPPLASQDAPCVTSVTLIGKSFGGQSSPRLRESQEGELVRRQESLSLAFLAAGVTLCPPSAVFCLHVHRVHESVAAEDKRARDRIERRKRTGETRAGYTRLFVYLCYPPVHEFVSSPD